MERPPPVVFPVADGITAIDTFMGGRARYTAAYLLEATETALVETGPGTSVEPVTEADVLWAIEKIRAQQPSAASSLESTTFEAAAPLIRRYLQGRRTAEARARYIRLLKQNPFAVDQGGQR